MILAAAMVCGMMAANVIRALDEEKIRHICHQDVL